MAGNDPNSSGDRATLVPPTDRLKILHIVAPAEFGGLERVLHALVVELAEHGHVVEVTTLLHDAAGDHPFIDEFADVGVSVRVVRLPARAYLREYRALREIIRQVRPHVVHTHGYRCDIIARRAAAAERVPTVTTSHGFSRGAFVNRLYEWLQRREFRKFDAVVAVSASMAEELRAAGVARARLEVLPNAVPVVAGFLDRTEARRRLGVPADGFRVGWVGRFAWAKGVDTFVHSLARVSTETFSASIIGEGSTGDDARSLSERLGITGRITWHGVLPSAAAYLPAFDALVISSRTEGTPMVLLEAMAAGVPVITTAVGGIPDVVTSREALLTEPDDPAALAAAIDAVHADPAAARERVAAARDRLVAGHGRTEWADRYEALYRRLLRS